MKYDESKLIQEAIEARENAVARFSGYKVGGALLTSDGKVVRGCNIENASYSLTVCAERVALLTALAAGIRGFEAVAVATQSEIPATPCGPCRQLLWEYTGDIDVILANTTGVVRRFKLSQLLPEPFTFDPES
jgi:cytidine deaminase